MATTIKGYLGIDNGTQGLSVIFTDESLHVVATGEATYDMVENLPDGCYEQRTEDWDLALTAAMDELRRKIAGITKNSGGSGGMDILGIGISGQMHGEVLCGGDGVALGPVRLWCDARNDKEGKELTKRFGVKVPKRSTVARFLWSMRNNTERASFTRHITTPAGWTSYRLTGEWTLGIGDAAGMFPIDQETLDYDRDLTKSFDSLLREEKHLSKGIPSIETLLPKVVRAGQNAGVLTDQGAKLLGGDISAGIPIAAAEGDQPAAMAGSLIGRAGMVSCSFGTSVCANSVGHKAFKGVSDAVDHFCAPDGKPINMVWLRNGTTFMNTIVASYGGDFSTIMHEVARAPADCGGLLALPFMDDEPGLHVSQGGTAMIVGWNPENVKNPGNAVKVALLSTIFNLKRGSDVLDQQGFPRTELILSGGLTKTPECGQIVADVFNTPVTLLESADEGSSWGAAVMAKYRHLCFTQSGDYSDDWSTFLETVEPKDRRRFTPNGEAVPVYESMYQRYTKLLALQPQLNDALMS